jgi:anti-sigma factor RsiW
MRPCDDIREQIAYYVDDELHETERARVEMHLAGCPACAAVLESELAFVERVRASRPYSGASDELRAAVERVVAGAPAPYRASDRLRAQVRAAVEGRRISFRRKAFAVVAATAVVGALGLWLAIGRRAHVHPVATTKFATIAVDAHQRRVAGALPLELVSAAPDAISRWFAGKVPFLLTLPNYQEASGQTRLYELEGARLVGYEDDYAAYVAYRMGERPISLVVTASSAATPAGGDEVEAKGLVFHCEVVGGWKVITWTDRGLTYALVSDLEERGQQSCLVCHEGARDRDFIEQLRPVT